MARGDPLMDCIVTGPKDIDPGGGGRRLESDRTHLMVPHPEKGMTLSFLFFSRLS